ncbi:unnamed protein product, partial [Hapterophycus canaliculatus]
MDVALDQLESIWPPYRGAVLLGAARESEGRVRNTLVTVTAGHIALSLEVKPTSAATTAATDAGSSRGTHQPIADGPELAAAAAATDVEGRVNPPATAVSAGQSPSSKLSLTVLLDAVPASAPTSGTHQMARFLTKVLSRSAGQDAGNTAGAAATAELRGQRKGVLGEDLPEMLIVEHHDEVICSEFLRFNHGLTSPTVGDGGGGASTGTDNDGLVYACIEASGLLRLWQWGGSDSCRWTWSYLNSSNICACREDPIGCRVLTAAIVPEPDSNKGKGDNARHRLVWEQEDSGEGAGLGLASTPAAGPRPPRRVWSRRITFDLAEGGAGGDGLWSGDDQRGEPRTGFGSVGGVSGACLEISLAFSACLLPTGVDALLCSRFGAWMPTGARVYFNHFATGRLPCIVLPSPVPGDRDRRKSADWADPGGASVGDGRGAQRGAGAGESDTFAGSESGPGVGESTPREDRVRGAGHEGQVDAGGEAFAGEAGAANRPRSPLPAVRRLFAVHGTAGDLMIYDHLPRPTVRVLSLPSGGGGGLALRRQCTLEPPPPPACPPRSFVVRSNLAVFSGGGACSVYDLCTGRLLGTGSIPRCPACAHRRRQRSRTASASFFPSGSMCACGRRQEDPLDSGPLNATAAVDTSPVLWASETRGHLVGILTTTHVLRVALPRLEACLAAFLAPRSRTGNPSHPSAPSTLRYLRDYKRLVDGPVGGAREASLLPELLRVAQQARHTDGNEADRGLAMMGLLGHTLAADDRG